MAINFGSLGSQLNQVNSKIQSGLQTVTQAVAQPNSEFPNLLNSAQSDLNTFSSSFSDDLTGFGRAINQNLAPGFSDFQTAINKTMSQIDPALGGVVTNLDQFSSNLQLQVSGAVTGITSQLQGNLSQIAGISNQLTGGITQLTDNIGQITGNVSQLAGQVSGGLSQLTGNLNQISGGFSNISGQLNNSLTQVSGVFGNISGSVANFNNSLSAGVNRLQSSLGNVSGVINTISSIASNPGRFIKDKLNGLVDAGLERILEPINRLTSLGQNLASSILNFNPITVITRDIANLQGLVGGRFAQMTEALQDTGNYYSLLTKGLEDIRLLGSSISGIDSGIGSGESSSRIENPLRNFNSFNSIITLGILTGEQYNTPESYRQSEFDRILVRSGGGSLSNRVRTYAEGSDNAEYFIDNLEIDAIIAPNPNTGVSTGLNVKFTVTEPYSMGKFLESMILGCVDIGYNNYSEAPFCIKVEFAGWDEYGEKITSPATPKYIPIKLINMGFEVTDQGSVYNVEAIAYNDRAMEDTVNQIKTPITSLGAIVHEVLETSSSAVTRTMNARIETLEEKKIIVGYDRYLIVFPKDRASLSAAIRSGVTNPDLLTRVAEEELAVRKGIEESRLELESSPGTVQVVSSAPPKAYSYLKTWAMNENNMNVIGRAGLTVDTRAAGTAGFTPPSDVYDDAILRGLRRDTNEAIVPEKSRDFSFDSGERVTRIIEEVVKSSQYIEESMENKSTPGFKPWFKIETMVFIEENDEVSASIGRPRMTYVYSVIPYAVDEAKVAAPTQIPGATAELKQEAAKEYNYYYSGKNEDIIDFNINFNNAFYQHLASNYGQPRATAASSQTGMNSVTGTSIAQAQRLDVGKTLEPISSITEGVNTGYYINGGTVLSAESAFKKQLADMIHDRIINSPIDMITAEMEIWGDPYFMPSDQGNYTSTPITPMLTADGTMNPTSNDVFIVLNFRTPLDYQINGFVMDMPELVRPFSGLFNVLGVTSVFNEGKFTQTLKLIRRRNQNAEGQITGTKSPVEEDPNPTTKLATPTISATAMSATGNLSTVGYGDGKIDPRLAAAVSQQLSGQGYTTAEINAVLTGNTSSATAPGRFGDGTRGGSTTSATPLVGYGAGQVDPRLAAAVQSRTTTTRPPTRPGQQTSGPAALVDRNAGGRGAAGGTFI